jgi:hypothetical protein
MTKDIEKIDILFTNNNEYGFISGIQLASIIDNNINSSLKHTKHQAFNMGNNVTTIDSSSTVTFMGDVHVLD